MDGSLKKLQEINPILAKLVDGNSLTTEEAERLIYTIFVNDTEGLHLATFVGAIHAKGETADELAGFLAATKRLAVQIDIGCDVDKTTDLSGTGGGKFKTINVSTAASFVVAAAGYTVAKAAYYGVTSPTGSADVFTALGVDFLKLPKIRVEQTLRKVGICPIIVPFISPKMKNRSSISRKFFVERKIQVRSPFHLASNIYSPLPMNHRIYGCYSEPHLEILAELFIKLGFKRSLTFCAEIGMPEISNVGDTIVVEQDGSKLKKYKLRPRDLGVEEARLEDIQTGGKKQNIIDFLRILKGKDKGAKADLVVINAAASLYVLGGVSSIPEGVEKAREILKSGAGFEKLQRLVEQIGSPQTIKG